MINHLTHVSDYLLRDGESERIQILRFWFCIMVVMIHAQTTEGINFAGETVLFQIPRWLVWTEYAISEGICGCAVPAFFLISSLMLYRKEFSWKNNLQKKLRTLIVPYLILNTFWIAVYFVAQRVPFTRAYFSQPENIVADWGAYDWINAYLGIYRLNKTTPFLGVLWFMRDLFVLNVLSTPLKRAIDRFPKILLLVLSCLLVFNVDLHLFFLNQTSLVFFCLGYYLVKYDIHISDVDRLHPSWIAVPYALSLLLLCVLKNRSLLPQVKALHVCLGILFFTRMSAFAIQRGTRTALALAKYNFIIYVFHENPLAFLRKLVTRLLPATRSAQAFIYFSLPPIIIALCIGAGMFLERFTPRLYALLTGGRSR